MTSDRAAQAIGAGLAASWLLVTVVLDVVHAGASIVLAPLFALSPLIACAVLPARYTSVFGVAAVILTLASGSWNHIRGEAQQVVRVIDVALISAVAVAVAAVRVRREQRFARVAAIAEVAQRAVLPTLPPKVGPVALGARYVSAARDAVVGGDLYDCYHSDEHLRFLVGDVRGKGIGAVEQAARVIRAFRQSAATGVSLPDVAREMSEYLAPFFDDEEFVTAVLVEVPDPGRLTIVSCGHPPTMLVERDGSCSLLEAPAGLPLGLGETYDAATLPWEPGNRLLMYTDGLSEARDADGRFLPLQPLGPLLGSDTLEGALEALLVAVRRHVPGGALTDDLAVMLLENLGVDAVQSEGPTASARDHVSAAG